MLIRSSLAPAVAFGDVAGANVAVCLVALGVGAFIAPLPFQVNRIPSSIHLLLPPRLPVAKQDHERAVCIVAAQALTRRRSTGNFVVDGYPDEDERNEEAVDMFGHDELGSVAVEDTLVEAYSSQTLDNVRMRQLFDGFPSRFGTGLPLPGYFTLSVDIGGAAGVRGDPGGLVAAVETWVRETAPMLPEPEIPQRLPNHAGGRAAWSPRRDPLSVAGRHRR